MASFSRIGSELELLAALNLSIPSNSRKLLQIHARAAHAKMMSQTPAKEADVAVFSTPPGLDAPPGLTMPDMGTPPLGLAAPHGLSWCKAESCCKRSFSGTDNHMESYSTSITSCSSSDQQDTELETESETEESQMKANSPCFVHGSLSGNLEMQPIEDLQRKVEVSYSAVGFLTNATHSTKMYQKHKSPLTTTLIGFPLPHKTQEWRCL